MGALQWFGYNLRKVKSPIEGIKTQRVALSQRIFFAAAQQCGTGLVDFKWLVGRDFSKAVAVRTGVSALAADRQDLVK